MSQSQFHVPVMVEEILEVVREAPDGMVVDATVGGGGHAEAILHAFPHRRLIGIDRDLEAVEESRQRLARFHERARIVHARFDELSAITGANSPIAVVLFDLGVSSHQLDTGSRGFSYRGDGPLDMRMDQSGALRAEDIVNRAELETLVELFREHGETRFAGRIARAIIAHRPIMTTGELADVVATAVPIPARRRGHPARRVFQAVRVAVNSELEILGPTLRNAIGMLEIDGRIAVLAYHSGEDRIVKQTFLEASTGGCICPPNLPCVCGAKPSLRLLKRGSRHASKHEIEMNPRAKSARLRVAARVDSSDAAGVQ